MGGRTRSVSDEDRAVIRRELRRLRRSYTQERIADDLGVSQATVSRWERPDAHIDAEHARAFAAMYGLELPSSVANDVKSGARGIGALSTDDMPKFGKAIADLGADQIVLRWLEHLNLPAEVPEETAHAVVGVLQGALSTVHGLLAAAHARSSAQSKVAGSVAAPRTAPKRAHTSAPPSPPASTLESPRGGPERRQRGRR